MVTISPFLFFVKVVPLRLGQTYLYIHVCSLFSGIIMFLFKFLSFIPIMLAQNENRLYRRLVLDEADWTKFIFKTITFDVKTKIECGSTCNYHQDQCSLFSYDEFLSKCHIGNFEHQIGNSMFGMHCQSSVYLFLGNTIQENQEKILWYNFLVFQNK